MYLVTVQVPIYIDGAKKFLATDWHRSLQLLRDSVYPHFGPLTVVAPSLPLPGHDAEQLLDRIDEQDNGIQLIPSFDRRCTCSSYWLKEQRTWLRDIRHWITRAEVVHSGIDDVYRPISFRGHVEAVKQRKPTVFVSDTDIVLQLEQLSSDVPRWYRLRSCFYSAVYDRMHRYGVRHASLTLLKGASLITRYGRFSKNMKAFHDTSYLSSEVIPEDIVLQRLDSLQASRSLRMVYCGRLIERKGVKKSITLIAAARRLGADVTLDIIGDGPESGRLAESIQENGLSGHVRLLGAMRYGPELLKRLAGYDAMLLTPLGEDTPRAIFDGYAAGLPVIGSAFAYLQDRATEDGAAIVFASDDVQTNAEEFRRICSQRSILEDVTRNAIRSARHHAADEWYRRRAHWTVEAVERHRAERSIVVTG